MRLTPDGSSSIPATIVIISIFLMVSTADDLLQQKKNIFDSFHAFIEDKFKSTTKHDHLQEILQKQLDSGLLVEEKIKVDEVAKLFTKQLRDLLLSYLDSLDAIKKQVAKSKAAHTFDPSIKPFNYFNDKQKNDVQLEPRFSTNVPVNLNQSFAQVPTDIYKHDKLILNDFAWLKDLDRVFLENYKNKPTLLWQYFSSENGASKTFPGVNNDLTTVDLYDPRRRIWYNQAIMSPKDVILALDMSGSMTGSHLTIAKLVVSSLLNTLQQDDYFNVISFNTDVDYLIPCIHNLSEATTANKRAYKNAIDEKEGPTGEADFPKALRTAFQILDRGALNPLATSGCSKVIMVISDGVIYDDRIEEVLAQYNGDRGVIIFSFIVGLKPDPELKEVACSNGGSYYHIQTLANVLDGVLKYQKVLSKPIGDSGNNYATFAPLYLDGSGLGMVSTVSTGVFVNNNNNKNKTELIGVAGIDIVTSLLQQQSPVHKMGAFGHAFAINNNGLFLLHPKFKDQTGYLPDPATVYLSEVEHTIDPSVSIELQRKMIDGEIGCEDAEIDWLFPRQHNTRVVRLRNTYCYRPVTDTPFYAGVSMSAQSLTQVKANDLSMNEYIESGIEHLLPSLQGQYNEVAKWPFCDVFHEQMLKQPASAKYYLTYKGIYEYLKKHEKLSETECDLELLRNLLLSASTVGNFTRDHWSTSHLLQHNVAEIYVITSAGFTSRLSVAAHHSDNLTTPINRDIFEDIRFLHPVSHYPKSTKAHHIFSVDTKNVRPPSSNLFNENLSTSIYVGRTIYPRDGSGTILATIGMTVDSATFADYIRNNFRENCPHNSNCYPFDCENTEQYQCFFVDENGYVVFSNQGGYQVGYFFGFFNGDLVVKLTELSIFNKTMYNDTQAQCRVYAHGPVPSDSSILKNFYSIFFNSIFLLTGQIIKTFTWILTCLLAYSHVSETHAYANTDGYHKNVSCTKAAPVYTIRNNSIDYTGELPCISNCKQYFRVKSIPGTNLNFIVTGNDCTSSESCPVGIVSNQPMRLTESNICEQAKLYRLPTKKCYVSTAKDRECFFEYANIGQDLFVYLTVGYSTSCAVIIFAMVLISYCRKVLC